MFAHLPERVSVYEVSPRELISKKPASEIRAFFETKLTPQLRLV